MKEGSVDTEVKLVQVFLNDTQVPGPSIHEVGITQEGKVVCNCPGFKGRASCKHSKIVKLRMEDNNGIYMPLLSPNVTDKDIEKAYLSNKNSRDFIIKFGIPEVI
jgi:hypothetical protein